MCNFFCISALNLQSCLQKSSYIKILQEGCVWKFLRNAISFSEMLLIILQHNFILDPHEDDQKLFFIKLTNSDNLVVLNALFSGNIL